MARTDNDSPFEIEYARTKRNGEIKINLAGNKMAISHFNIGSDEIYVELAKGVGHQKIRIGPKIFELVEGGTLKLDSEGRVIGANIKRTEDGREVTAWLEVKYGNDGSGEMTISRFAPPYQGPRK